MRWIYPTALMFVVCGTLACGEDDPVPTNNLPNNVQTNNVTNNVTNSATNSATNNPTNNVTPECVDDPSLYSPGADAWPACVSDSGEYTPFEATITTAARVAAFEQIAELLWRNQTPSPQDFASAYEEYSLGEGLLSRVARREDEHYPPVIDQDLNVLSCRDEGVPAMDPQRCVGPAQMIPLLNDAFEAGLAGTEPLVQAAKIEATLLWFLYLSTHKEAVTCANTLRDCDSAFAYYTGNFQRDGGIGLAGYYRRLHPAAHDATFDGVLAVRCWRDVDSAVPPENDELMDRAIDQLDRGMLYGFAAIVRDRIRKWESSTGAQRAAHWAALQILGRALVRESVQRDDTLGNVIANGFAQSNDANFDAASVKTAIGELFGCL